MKTSKLLVGCVIGCLTLLVLVLVGGFLAYRYYLKPEMEKLLGKPEDIGPAGVVQGQGLLSQATFLADSRLGAVTDLAQGKLDPAPGVALAVAGGNGAAFLDRAGKLISFVPFGDSFDRIAVVDVEGDGVCEFMNRGSAGYDAALLDHNGKQLWTYRAKGGSVSDMAAGDVDKDGLLEFAVGFMGNTGVHLLDRGGAVRWKRPDANVWCLGMADINGDGGAEIIHSNGSGQLRVRDEFGNIVSQTQLAARPTSPTAAFTAGFFHISLAHWPTESSSARVIAAGRDVVEVFDTGGKSLARFKAPKAGFFSDVLGVPVKLRKDLPEYFAVVVTFQLADRSVLYLYNSNQGLVYQEVLDEPCHALAALPLGKTGEEALLVGGEGKVWEYRAAKVGKG